MSSLPHLEHTYAAAVPDLSTPWRAAPVAGGEVLALDEHLAAQVGLDPAWLRTDEGAAFLVGRVPEEQPTYAHAYSGHQFGNFSPVLGDGRALLLGELVDEAGRRCDLHLKGSGRTPFARGGDGLAAVGPMLREFLMGRAMHALGVPSTRALAVVATGVPVFRERPLPGAVMSRIADSHLRVGTVQYASALGRPDVLQALVEYAVDRHHPQAREAENLGLGLLDAVVAAQARLIASWMGIGFIHGVMNTDNMTLSGQTIDYGPCAFLDAHEPATVFSSIDHAGRYAYGNQPAVAQWNLARLAEALLPLIAGPEPTQAVIDAAVEQAGAAVGRFGELYEHAHRAEMGRRFGLVTGEEATAVAPGSAGAEVVADGVALMAAARVDHTRFLRGLAENTARAEVEAAGGDVAAFEEWDRRRTSLLPGGPEEAATRLRTINPVYIPRNHVVEAALSAATEGDLAPFARLVETLEDPYTRRASADSALASPAPADAAPHITYCGT